MNYVSEFALLLVAAAVDDYLERTAGLTAEEIVTMWDFSIVLKVAAHAVVSAKDANETA